MTDEEMDAIMLPDLPPTPPKEYVTRGLLACMNWSPCDGEVDPSLENLIGTIEKAILRRRPLLPEERYVIQIMDGDGNLRDATEEEVDSLFGRLDHGI